MRLLRVLVIFCSYFSPFEGKLWKDDACVGMRRGNQYDFDLPDAVAVNVQDDSCDAEWTVNDEHTAILDGKSINFTLPFKNVTTFGISVIYCPYSLKYHVSCHAYTMDLKCSCTESTVSSTHLLPTTDSGYPEYITTDLTKRNHYVAYVVAGIWCICLILSMARPSLSSPIILRNNSLVLYAPARDSAAERNQPDSSV